MIDNGAIGLPFGAFFGVVFHAYSFPGMHDAKLLDERCWKPFVRLALTLMLCIPFTLFKLIGPNQISNVYWLMFFSTLLPSFMSSFIMFGISDHVNIALNLLKLDKNDQ